MSMHPCPQWISHRQILQNITVFLFASAVFQRRKAHSKLFHIIGNGKLETQAHHHMGVAEFV